MELIIREFNMQSDIPHAAVLMEELGYPTTEAQFKKRMEAIHTNPDYYTFIAVASGAVAGFIGIVKQYAWEFDDAFFRVQALVVKNEFRGKSVGTALIRHAEQIAKEHGATSILLNSGNRPEREAAHQFYPQLGFEAKSTGYKKML